MLQLQKFRSSRKELRQPGIVEPQVNIGKARAPPGRQLRSGLKHFEQISLLIDPNSEKALLDLTRRTLRDLQQPSKKHPPITRELFRTLVR